MEKEVTLKYLLYSFLKIGATSFGGFMAMVSVIQDQMVTKNKVIKNDIILDGISLASVMPGPLAVNVVTYIGYQLKGIKGALISMLAVITPSYILVLGLSWSYLEYGSLPMVDKIFSGILPAVVAVIIVVAVRMAKISIRDYKQWVICILSGLLFIYIGGFFLTLSLIFAGGLTGYLLYNKSLANQNFQAALINGKKKSIPYYFYILPGVVILGILLFPQLVPQELYALFADIRKLMVVFGGMSLTLFGGGYVFIPAMQEIVVQNLHWLTVKEFTDSIAMGQITPGPILISATFIGYKVAGFWGSIVATLAIFLPSGILMIVGSHFLEKFKNSNGIKAIFLGLRPAVIGLIFAASITIGKSVVMNWQSVLIFLIIFLANFKFKVNVALLIPFSGVLGLILFQF